MAGIYLYACYSAVQFGIYEELKKYVNKVTKDAFFYRFQGAMGKGGIGAVAAMGGTLISYPFDLIRTRHSLQKSAPSQYRYYKSIIPTIQTIIREEGIRGLYKGIGPSLAQVVPYMGIVFATFEKSKSILLSTSLSEHPTNLLSGIVSGFLSKLIMMPVDVVRKRMQIQGSYYNAYVLKGLPIYSDLLDCIRGIWRVEGGRGFFSGLSFALLKSVPATATTFVVYGLIKNM